MGLDMYLREGKDGPDLYYWRKAYAIDEWFFQNCDMEYDEDPDCAGASVSRELVIKLVADCREFLSSAGETWKGKEFSRFPVTEEWEIDYIRETVTGLEEILEDTTKVLFYYKQD